MGKKKTANPYADMSLKEISKEYTRLRDIAVKRVKRVAKAGMTQFSSIKAEPKKIKDFYKDQTARRHELILATEELNRILKHGTTKVGDVRKKVEKIKKEIDRKRLETYEKLKAQGKKKLKAPEPTTLEDIEKYNKVIGKIWALSESLSLPSDVTYSAIEDAGYPPDFEQIFKELSQYIEKEDKEGRKALAKLRKEVNTGSF